MMRVTPKISDMPTETRNRNIPTLNPLITWTTMSGPLVIHGRRLVIISTVGLGVGGGTGVLRRPARPHEGYLFLVAAARSCATSSQLFTSSLPWISSTSATIGLPSSPIFTTPAHCGAIACWSQPRMITLPHGNSISNPSLSTAMTLSGSVLFARLMDSAMMYALAYPQDAPSLGCESFMPGAGAHSVYFLFHSPSLGCRASTPSSYQGKVVVMAPMGASLPRGSSSSGVPMAGVT